jgi:acetyl/propionyl-CoA carboxylase alpha subunit
VQRRYQKLIEETPSPMLSERRREEMGEAAVAIARACGYRSAGTVEFLYDLERDEYYFLEVNARLQVEHPITELVTGVDLVKEQLVIGAGCKLSLKQDEIQRRGAAIECRIYAEDPELDFAPSTGEIKELLLPTGPGVRVDTGVERGSSVPPYYDPLIMKLIVWGEDRRAAITRMKSALEELLIVGVATTVGFHLRALEEESFRSGRYTTSFVSELGPEEPSEELLEAVAVAAALARRQQKSLIRGREPMSEDRSELLWKWAS